MFKNEACEKSCDTRTFARSILALKHFNVFLPIAPSKVFCYVFLKFEIVKKNVCLLRTVMKIHFKNLHETIKNCKWK